MPTESTIELLTIELDSENSDTRLNAVREVGRNWVMTRSERIREAFQDKLRQMAASDPDDDVVKLATRVLNDMKNPG